MNITSAPNYFKILTITGVALLFCFASCRPKRDYNDSPNLVLKFSQDTVRFDTVFTTLSSTTKQVLVINPTKEWVQISRIYLREKTLSFFRINVNGDTSSVVQNVKIAPGDSIYIFIKVTINPNNTTNPFEIQEQIVLEFNNKQQSIILTAWGQNAYYHLPTHSIAIPYYNKDKLDTFYIHYSLADCTKPMETDKPHIIYGYLLVNEGETLEIPNGCRLHFAPSAGLWVYDGASLKVRGTLSEPVTFQGMRLEKYYEDVAGQWNRIWLSRGSINNQIDYAIIKNGTVGILADSVANNDYHLKINNTIIKNMSSVGILSQGSKIIGTNLVISNCQTANLALTLGGEYDFYHSTFADYWRGSSNNAYSLLINNYYVDINQNIQLRPLSAANFTNCIFFGESLEEIFMDLKPETQSNYYFDHCLLKTKISPNAYFNQCIFNTDPAFKNTEKQIFEINSTKSPVVKTGLTSGAIFAPQDIKGVPRLGTPTIGAYEYTPESPKE